MSIYSRYVLPKLIHLTCSASSVQKQRSKIIPLANGRVLEVGFGSGLNVPFYRSNHVDLIWALDPSSEMMKLSEIVRSESTMDIRLLEAPAQSIPLEDDSVDTVVLTYTLCSIQQENTTLSEIRRVLKADGKMVFCEHGSSPDNSVRKWQDRIDPIWSRLGGGCHLNKDIPSILLNSGFKFDHLKQSYIPGWKPACYNFWGVALAR